MKERKTAQTNPPSCAVSMTSWWRCRRKSDLTRTSLSSMSPSSRCRRPRSPMRRAVAWSMTNSSLCSTASSTRPVTLLRSNRPACSWKRSWLFTKFTVRGRAEAMELQLRKIQKLHGRLELLSGLRIGASESEIRIGGVDNQVIRHPHTGHPYIPGSSLKGKVRSLLEWLSGGDQLEDSDAAELGPTRLAFWDAPLNEQWRKEIEKDNLLVEVKTENRIDRIRGVAEHPRQTERVPAGAVFDFTVSMKVLNIDGDGEALRTVLFRGLRLLELDSLGGSGSRGYGKVKFRDLALDHESVQNEFEKLDPFSA